MLALRHLQIQLCCSTHSQTPNVCSRPSSSTENYIGSWNSCYYQCISTVSVHLSTHACIHPSAREKACVRACMSMHMLDRLLFFSLSLSPSLSFRLSLDALRIPRMNIVRVLLLYRETSMHAHASACSVQTYMHIYI